MALLTIAGALAQAAETLRSHGIASPRLDAEVILADTLGVSRTEIYINSADKVPDALWRRYQTKIDRRAAGEPVAYITGTREFMSLRFNVDSSVLIPRPETELIVEEALAIKPLCIIDVGTGSGAIAISLAVNLPAGRVWAIDISGPALSVARGNAEKHKVAERITFLQGNLLEPLSDQEFIGHFDLLAANLPYIPAGEMDNLPVDVLDFEPRTALDGGVDGLDYYRAMLPAAYNLLRSGGVMLLEIGYNQAAELTALLVDRGFAHTEVLKDLASLDRVVKAVK